MKKYKTLKDHVYDYIAKEILEGTLLPAQRINETAISQELSVSRTPVREALIQLSCEGILDNIPRRGFTLREVSEKEAIDLYAVIGTLDGMAAQISCSALTDSDLKKMDFYMQSINLAIQTSNYEMYLEQQEAFHQVYLDKCGNQVLADILTHLKSKFFTRGYSKNNSSQDTELLYSINKEHQEILELFRKKDSAALFDYLVKVHWSPSHAHNELLYQNQK